VIAAIDWGRVLAVTVDCILLASLAALCILIGSEGRSRTGRQR
jgi:hypothetical protein